MNESKPLVAGVSPGGVPFTITGELAGVSKFWGKYVEAGAHTPPLLSSTSAVSDTKIHPKHPLNDALNNPSRPVWDNHALNTP